MTSLPLPNSSTFLPSLIEYVNNHPQSPLDFDRQIFVGILLCMVVGGANLIVDVDVSAVRAESERRSAVKRVAGMVELITSNIFGRSTQSFHAPSETPPGLSAQSILFPPAKPTNPAQRPGRPQARHRRRQSSASSSPRTGSTPILSLTPLPLSASIHSMEPSPSPSGLTKMADSRGGPSLSSSVLETPVPCQPKEPPQVLVVRSLDKTTHSLRLALMELLTKRSYALPSTLEDAEEEKALSKEFMCVWVREAGAEVPDWLLDRFSLSCSSNPDALVGDNEYEPPFPAVQLRPVIPAAFIYMLHNLSSRTHMHPLLRLQLADITSLAMHHPRLNSNLTSKSIEETRDFIRASRVLFRQVENAIDDTLLPSPSDEAVVDQTPTSSMFLTQEVRARHHHQYLKLAESTLGQEHFATMLDLRRVWGNTVRHRVRLRPEREEVMWGFKGGACFGPTRLSVDGAGVAEAVKGSLGDGKREKPDAKRGEEKRKRKDEKLVTKILNGILDSI